MELGNQLEVSASQPLVDARRCPRYKLNIEIRIYPRNCPVVRGHTVDISESGISAMLLVEVPVGEVIRLEFSLPFGDVQVHAMVQQRLAFRYGFSSSRPVRPGRHRSHLSPTGGRAGHCGTLESRLKIFCFL